MCSSQGPTTTSTNFNPYTTQWNDYINNVGGLTQTNPITPYSGPMVAPQNDLQNQAAQMQQNFSTGGSPAGNMANAQIVAQSSGAIANPYATTTNPYMGATNPYAGSSPYENQVVDSSNAAIANAYANGTAAQTAGAFNQNNAYGGSAYQTTQAQNNLQLANALAQNTYANENQNYQNSGQLANADLTRNSGLAQGTINNATQAFQNQQQNALQGSALGLQSQGVDQNAISNLYNMGANQQGNTQNVLNAMQQYFTQSQAAPYTTQQLFGNALTQASNANNATSVQQPGASPLANITGLVGAGTALYNLFNPAPGSMPTSP